MDPVIFGGGTITSSFHLECPVSEGCHLVQKSGHTLAGRNSNPLSYLRTVTYVGVSFLSFIIYSARMV